MKKITILLLFILFTSQLMAQEVVASSGTSISNANGSIDFTIGEAIIFTLTDTSNTLTQGFQQPDFGILAVSDFDLRYQARVYPNPTSSVLYLEIQLFEDLNYQLFDLQGRQLLKSAIKGRNTELSLNAVASGMYLLVVSNENNQNLKTYRIIKN